MEGDTLSKVIRVEMEIQERIDHEKARSHDWLENIKKECEEELLQKKERLGKAVEKIREDARMKAQERAAAMIRSAEEDAERITKVHDDVLTEIVLSKLTRILWV